VTDEERINRHGDHIASCLCCSNCEYLPETQGWSDQTPGEPGRLECAKKQFLYYEAGIGAAALKTLHDKARNCPHFRAIEG